VGQAEGDAGTAGSGSILTTPYDLTNLRDRPNPGANILGQGCLAGFQPCSMYKPTRVGTIPQQYNKGAFVFEAEPGEGWNTDIRRVSEKEADTDLSRMVAHLKSCREMKVQPDPITAYVLPIDWHIFAGKPIKSDIDKLFKATDFIAKRVVGHVDAFMVDAHNFSQIAFDVWCSSVKHRFAKAASYGKPVDLVWEMKWHMASTPTFNANKPLSEVEATRRVRFLQSLKPRGIFLMGGWNQPVCDAMADFPALPAICNLLTGKAA